MGLFELDYRKIISIKKCVQLTRKDARDEKRGQLFKISVYKSINLKTMKLELIIIIFIFVYHHLIFYKKNNPVTYDLEFLISQRK